MRWQLFSVLPVWLLSIASAIVIGIVLPHGSQITWLPIALGVCVIVTFIIQLAIQRTAGFVNRAMASIGGAAIVLAAATVVFLLGG
jgi:hypothetical protein